MLRRTSVVVEYAAKDENFVAVVGAAIVLVLVGTVVVDTLGEAWSVV